MDISQYLQTSHPVAGKYDLDFLDGQDAVDWAAGICLRNAKMGLNLQAMKSAFQRAQGVDGVVHIDANRPAMAKAVVNRIREGKAGHASLQLLNIDSVVSANRFPRGQEIYEQHFRRPLEEQNPLGHYAKMSL